MSPPSYKVQLIYFRATGKYLTRAETTIADETIERIWAEIDEMRRLGRLPGLRPGAGRDLFILVEIPSHPQHVPHLVMPPSMDEDDITPPRGSTQGELVQIVRMPLEEIPRTTTRDVVKMTPDLEPEEVTPVDVPVPRPDPYDTPRVDEGPPRGDEDTPVAVPLPKPPTEE